TFCRQNLGPDVRSMRPACPTNRRRLFYLPSARYELGAQLPRTAWPPPYFITPNYHLIGTNGHLRRRSILGCPNNSIESDGIADMGGITRRAARARVRSASTAGR